MKKLLSAGLAFAALIAGPATAADLGRPAYRAPVAYVPVASWTGFYAGINVGGSFGGDTVTSGANAALPAQAIGPEGLVTSSNTLRPAGAVLGGQLGYNYQIANWLVGFEADWDWTSQRDSYTACTPPSATANGVGFFNGLSGSCLTSEHKITNIGTVRGRGGVIVHDSLWYVTGGLAWGTVKENDAFAAPCPRCASSFAGISSILLPTAASFSTNRTGWTVGGGVETKLFGGWSAKLEYLHVDLGNINNAYPIAFNPAYLALLGPGGGAGATAGAIHTSRVTDDIVRIGLNYQFGSYAAPAVYK